MLDILALSALMILCGILGYVTIGAGAAYEQNKPSPGYIRGGMAWYLAGVAVGICAFKFWERM